MGARAKICGIRTAADLVIAVDAGADAVGLISGVTHVSEDALSAEAARALAEQVPPFVSVVLVTHLESVDEILDLATFVRADTIQVHGLVDVATTRTIFERWPGRVVRAVHVLGPKAIGHARDVAAYCHAVLLDSRTEDRLGGTGTVHDWHLSAQIVAELGVRGRETVLAGGLTAGNVGEARAVVRPYAVDVNSGVERPDGSKDPALVRAFVASAHGCD